MHALLLIGLLLANDDIVAMQGEWKAVWIERDGHKTMIEGDPPLYRYVIRGDKLYGKDAGRPTFALKIDSKFTPKLLDSTVLYDGPDRGQMREAIYRIEGCTMLWCWSEKKG